MDTLVLNSSYMPIDRISWRDALSRILTGRAEVVEEYEGWTVCSPSTVFKVPSIIRFLGKVAGLFRKGVRFNRHNVYLRDKGRCGYCGLRVSRSSFTYDHVVPRHQGGKTTWTNVVVSCLPCNQEKSNRTPRQAGMVLKTKPHRPKTLPGGFNLSWDDKMPGSWQTFLRNTAYWHGQLDEG